MVTRGSFHLQSTKTSQAWHPCLLLLWLTCGRLLGVPDNQFAQYTLGKLYLQGKEVQQDREAARQWLDLSAAQGNQYAQFFLDRLDNFRDPSILMAATRLLHHMSRIFQNNSQPPTNPNGIRIDSKRRRRLQEKRMAMGHKRDDHEEQINYQQSM